MKAPPGFTWEHGVGVAAALLWLALALHGAWVKSPVMDEVAHIGDGLAIVRHGDYRMNPEHPPLLKVLAVLPLELISPSPMEVDLGDRELVPWVTGDQYAWGHYLLYYDRTDWDPALWLVRLVPIGFGLAGGILAWWWAAMLAGRRAGLAAMLLLLFYPEYLGHARYVTLDVPTLVACAAVGLSGMRYWQRPTPRRAAVFAAAAVVLSFVKIPVVVYTVFLFATFGLLLAFRGIATPGWARALPRRGPGWLRVLVLGLAVAALGFTAQWVAAGGRFSLTSPGVPPMDTVHRFLDFDRYPDTVLAGAIRFAHDWRLLPEATLAVLAHTGTAQGRIVFLFDEQRLEGWYHYFAVTTAIKTPGWLLAGLLGVLVYTAWIFLRGRGWERERLALLLLPILGLLALVVAARLNIGHRHILFVYFPWCVLLGVVLARWAAGRHHRLGQYIYTGMLVAGVALCLGTHPHHATYINWLGGGSPLAASRILRDSNVDWGQDLKLMAGTLDELEIDRVNLAYFGSGRPQAYGIRDFNFILYRFPLAIMMPDYTPPDPNLPTAVSVHLVPAMNRIFPGQFDRDPVLVVNSMVIYAPFALEGDGTAGR